MKKLVIFQILKAIVKKMEDAFVFYKSYFMACLGLPLVRMHYAVGDEVQCKIKRHNCNGVDIKIVTPEGGHYMTTFYDVDPFSPSGKFMVVTAVPFIERIPMPGDKAYVCVIDLIGGVMKVVYCTEGWGAQLGANAQWGKDDETILCNDFQEGKVVGVVIDRSTCDARLLDGAIFGKSPDSKYSYSGDLRAINAGIPGYGVPEGPRNKIRQRSIASKVDGIWRTDLESGYSELFLSIHEIVSVLPEQENLQKGVYYIFNIKINRQGNKMFCILFSRGVPSRPGWPPQLVVIDLETKKIKLVVPDRLWRLGGHHPNWCPDGESILMNLRVDGGDMAFVKFTCDGDGPVVVAPGVKGSGHPSIDPQQQYLLTDAYTNEGDYLDKNKEVPIRIVDLKGNGEFELARVYTKDLSGPCRIDPHPVWSANGEKLAYNGIKNGFRQVFVIDRVSIDNLVSK